MNQHPVVFFDGVCNFCNDSVNFIIKRDPEAVFRFAPLQSDIAQTMLQQLEFNAESFDTIVLLENDKLYTHSTAALRISKRLKGAWKFLYVFMIVPAFIRDAVYNIVARNRYRWFGKKTACMIPDKELKARFL